ncbi:MAG: hypothetical protein GKR88_00165 [Flavobacteriaceae bacterium]|nr:MAG: hypothetical protein GKR88_00165 [Flavobacteriaceae bacterium]
MNNKLSKILTIGIAVIAVIGVILFFVVASVDEGDLEALNSATSPLITFSTLLIYLTVGVTLVLSIMGIIKNPESLKKTLLSIGVLAVLLGIAYLLADSNAVLDTQGEVLKGGEAGTASNQWAGSLIWYSIVLGCIGGLFFIYDLLKGLIKS